MVQLEFLCFGAELFIAHLNTSLMSQLHYDIVEFLLVRLAVVNGAAKAIYKAQLLLHGIGLVDALVMSYIIAVLPGLVNQMTTIAGSVNQNIARTYLKATLNDGLEVFIFCLKFLKGKVVHINYKAIIAALDLGNNSGQILKLMLINFDHA